LRRGIPPLLEKTSSSVESRVENTQTEGALKLFQKRGSPLVFKKGPPNLSVLLIWGASRTPKLEGGVFPREKIKGGVSIKKTFQKLKGPPLMFKRERIHTLRWEPENPQ